MSRSSQESKPKKVHWVIPIANLLCFAVLFCIALSYLFEPKFLKVYQISNASLLILALEAVSLMLLTAYFQPKLGKGWRKLCLAGSFLVLLEALLYNYWTYPS